MSRRGQGGRRAKGRRGGQDPELENTAWLAELEREAAQAADDEDGDDWASTLRGRRSPTPPPPAPPAPPASEPGWAPPPDPSALPPALPPADYGVDLDGAGPGSAGTGAWSADPAPQDPPPAPEPDWSSWRQPAADPFDASPGPGFADPFEAPRGPVPADPAPEGPGQDWDGSRGGGDQGWQPAGVDTPTGAWSPSEPVGREPDYPALFGELYRRGAGRQDPIWEAPPAAEPLPDQAQTDPPSGGWPFEETTGTWEPSDRSFIWPADELPSTQAEWVQPVPPSWLDDPGPQAPAAPSAHGPTPPRPDPAVPPAPDETAAWPAPAPEAWADPEPAPRPSPWASQPGGGNGASPGGPVVPPAPPPTGPLAPPADGPPPADWASAIPTDVPAARRAGHPGAATRAWRPDEAIEAEPGVPLGAGTAAGGGQAGSARAAGPAPMPVEEPEEVWPPAEGRRKRPAGERQARAWPRIVAVISWIVLVMVLCWYYVFPWLERVLPENF
jgi:hypothetical protein